MKSLEAQRGRSSMHLRERGGYESSTVGPRAQNKMGAKKLVDKMDSSMWAER